MSILGPIQTCWQIMGYYFEYRHEPHSPFNHPPLALHVTGDEKFAIILSFPFCLNTGNHGLYNQDSFLYLVKCKLWIKASPLLLHKAYRGKVEGQCLFVLVLQTSLDCLPVPLFCVSYCPTNKGLYHQQLNWNPMWSKWGGGKIL